MKFLTQATTFPAIILPAFIGAAFLLAVLLRYRKPAGDWRYREIVTTAGGILAMGCAGLAVLSAPRHIIAPEASAADSAPSIEADMLVSRGNGVELWLNDWRHPPERLAVVAGERHVYRFTSIPRQISLIRIDPTDLPDARIAIYSLTVKAGNRIVRQFGPAELSNWRLNNLSAPKVEGAGLVMLDANDDPILWAPVEIPLPQPEQPSRLQLYYRPLALSMMAALLAVLALLAGSKGSLSWLDAKLPERYRDLLMSSWTGGLMVLLAAAGMVYLQEQSTSSGVGLEVDMLVSRGNGVDLWCNDWQHPPERLPVVAGQRHIYRFEKLPREIRLLRLDPTDVPEARIVLYSVVVKSRDRIFLQFGPAELKSWTRTNLSQTKEEDGGLALTDTNDDPMLTTSLALQLPGGLLPWLAPLIGTPDSPILLAITVFLLVLLARMSSRTGRMQALLVAMAGCLVYPAVLLVIRLKLLMPPPVKSTVGYASYNGYPKANEYLSALAAMLLCIALAYLFARLAGNESGVEEFEATVQPSRRRNVWIAHVAVLGLLFVYFLPNLGVVLHSINGLVYRRVDWDNVNFLIWDDLIHVGLLPYRDFWYPYSGAYTQSLPFPLGSLAWALHQTVVLGVLYLTLYKATGRRLSHSLAVFGLILALVLLGILPGWSRYLLAVEVVLFYIAIYDSRRLEWKMHAPFAVFVGYAFFYEPTQVIYAGVGIVAHTVLSAIMPAAGSSPGSWLRQRIADGSRVLKQRLVCVGVPMLAGISASLLIYAVNGMLPGLWDFERSLGDQGDYGALPSDISAWVLPLLQPETVFLMMFLLAAYAMYRWARCKGRHDDLGSALIVLCCASFMAMQKQIVRPHVMAQLRLFPYVAALIFGLIMWRERKPAARFVILAFLGCMLGIVEHRNVLRTTFQQEIVEGPGRISGSVDALLHHRQEFARANAGMFSRSRFAGFDEENAVVDQLVQACGLRPEDKVYVLGDYAVFYLLLNQPPPYNSNSYNDSPIYEQQKVLDWLQRKNPRFVIWGTDTLGYDTVPHMVRLPLIYTYVVEHYRFLRAIGPYHILTERPLDHPPDLEYWRRVLSDRVDLGFVPSRARLGEYAACGADVARCDAVLLVKYRQAGPVPRGKLTVDIASTGGPFRVQFDTIPGEREYVVNLNRLWFWSPLSKALPKITAEDAAVEAVMEYRRERSPVLY